MIPREFMIEFPALEESDKPLIKLIAGRLVPIERMFDKAALRKAVRAAAECVANFKMADRFEKARADAENLRVCPVRIAKDGEARFYWRVILDDRSVVRVGKDPSVGSLALARKKATELICQGRVPVELVPPDYDPTNQAEQELQRNTAGVQPTGLTVRQREKRH